MSIQTDIQSLEEYFRDRINGKFVADPRFMLEAVQRIHGHMDYLQKSCDDMTEWQSRNHFMEEIKAIHDEMEQLSEELAGIKDLHDELNKLIAENEMLRREQAELQKEIDSRSREGFPFINPINPPPISPRREPIPWWFNQPTCSVSPGMWRSETTTTTTHPEEEKPKDE